MNSLGRRQFSDTALMIPPQQGHAALFRQACQPHHVQPSHWRGGGGVGGGGGGGAMRVPASISARSLWSIEILSQV